MLGAHKILQVPVRSPAEIKPSSLNMQMPLGEGPKQAAAPDVAGDELGKEGRHLRTDLFSVLRVNRWVWGSERSGTNSNGTGSSSILGEGFETRIYRGPGARRFHHGKFALFISGKTHWY